jgi:hypothetical protein
MSIKPVISCNMELTIYARLTKSQQTHLLTSIHCLAIRKGTHAFNPHF